MKTLISECFLSVLWERISVRTLPGSCSPTGPDVMRRIRGRSFSIRPHCSCTCSSIFSLHLNPGGNLLTLFLKVASWRKFCSAGCHDNCFQERGRGSARCRRWSVQRAGERKPGLSGDGNSGTVCVLYKYIYIALYKEMGDYISYISDIIMCF